MGKNVSPTWRCGRILAEIINEFHLLFKKENCWTNLFCYKSQDLPSWSFSFPLLSIIPSKTRIILWFYRIHVACLNESLRIFFFFLLAVLIYDFLAFPLVSCTFVFHDCLCLRKTKCKFLFWKLDFFSPFSYFNCTFWFKKFNFFF